MQRRQDLPEDAFVSPADAPSLLREGKVAALSYKWLGICEPDPERYHLDAIVQFFKAHPRKQTALMWDFASVCQRNPYIFAAVQILVSAVAL